MIIVFAIGIIGQMVVIAPSGTINEGGDIIFYSSHGHDGPWHIALMNEIKKGYPFEMPVMAGEKLTNYHFFSDILPAVASKYFNLSDLDLYFRIFPTLYSILFGASAYFLTYKLTKSESASIWATIFSFFAGSFGYLIGKGESVFWATQPQSASGNPPQIISNFLFLAGIYFVINFIETKDKNEKKNQFIYSLVVVGTLSAFKIYAGFTLLLTLSIVSIIRLVKSKKWDLFILTFLSGVVALALYIPNSTSGSSFLIFEPWWYIRTMIVESSRLNLIDWELRRQTYIYEENWKRVIWLEGLGFLIFFFGNLGMRFLGLIEFIKTHIIIKVSIVISLIFPLLFLQKGVASNTAQFLQYFILLFGILAGITTSKILNSKLKTIIFAPLIIVLMIPTQITLLKDFYGSFKNPRPPFTRISSDEIKALEFIKNQTNQDSVILTPPYNQHLNQMKLTPEIWDWFDTSYVAAFSNRATYFDDYEQVDIMGYNYKDRLNTKIKIFETMDLKEFNSLIAKTNSDYLYLPKDLMPKIDLSKTKLNKVFENQSVEIWKIQK